ncbi:MAG: class I SAM-dependent methyltransferase [Bdellovibrionales bacterium]
MSEIDRELFNKGFSIRQWWDQAHSVDHPNWLTGSSGKEVWRRLAVLHRIRPGTQVLNIGVGLGHCTHGLKERGCSVSALDISPVALSRVKSLVENSWLPEQLPHLPADQFDVAISHLVAQHMTDENLTDQLRHVIRALKPDGVLAIQIAYRMNRRPNPTDQATLLELEKGGGICRHLYEIMNVCSRAGGAVTWAKRVKLFKDFGSGWYGLHIRKVDYKGIPGLRESLSLIRTLEWEIRDLNNKGMTKAAGSAKDLLNPTRSQLRLRLAGTKRLIFERLT